MEDIKKIQEEIDKTKSEIVMSGYHDGWTLQGYKDKLKKLELELKKIIEDDNSSIFHKDAQ
tara:strand:- start:228 stop:410 length:183 start_codon:yes stop_codon:yes gene_type:complete